MLLLALDTSGAYVSVALMTEKEIISHTHQVMERGQGEALIPLILKMMTHSSYQMSDLEAVAVAVGPGSFTGVRIALAAARGIGLALDIPVMGVTNFESAAYGIFQPVHVILDTKRGDYYVQRFDAQGKPVSEYLIEDADSLKKALPFVAVGNGAVSLAQKIGCDVVEQTETPAVRTGQVALERLSNPRPAEPLYLRDADVTLPG